MRFPLTISRYRLCWCSCLALVLLRVGVGWHFLYEGLWKIESWRDGTKPFSAEGYIANSSGPFRAWFRSQLDDPEGLERLEPEGRMRRWEAMIAQLDRRHQITEEQRASAQAKMAELDSSLLVYFADDARKTKLDNYRDEIAQVMQNESADPDFLREHARERRRELAKTRDELLAPVDAATQAIREHVTAGLAPEQIEQKPAGMIQKFGVWLKLPFPLAWPERAIDQINITTMLGLTVCGGLLVVGLFSRLAALGAAGLVGAFYLCNPGPPLGTSLPGDPGHYLYVNKELIECLAALVLATIPTGRWLGLDAIIRGLITRRLTGIFVRTPDDATIVG